MTRDEIIREIELLLNEVMTVRDNYDLSRRLYLKLKELGVIDEVSTY